MPAMGADMTEGTIVKWLKAEGDQVKRGDKIAEIETDKTVVEMESYNDGLLRKILVSEGEKVPVGSLIAYIGGANDAMPDARAASAAPKPTAPQHRAEQPAPAPARSQPATPAPAPKAEAPAPAPQRAVPAPSPAPATAPTDGRVKASPIARRLAEERGIDIGQVPGTGPGGRVTRDDVLNFRPSPAFAAMRPQMAQVQVDGSDIPLTNMRKAIARVTVRSKTQAPHYYVTHAVDMTDAMRFRAQMNEALGESGDRVSVNDMIIKAVANALVKYPKWNAFFSDEKLIGHSDINIGIAIALDQGLIVPALMRVQNMTLVEISRGTKDLGKRARGEGGTLTQEELTLGTFGTSNLGMFGTDVFAAIIVPPQSGIIAVGAVKPTPVVRDDQIVIRQIMNATISADHRVGDGAEAAVFLREVQRNLENPARLVL
jgi:pyruvate dehydrogenase E2 component (dihydrolipoamide acetyltransferase)